MNNQADKRKNIKVDSELHHLIDMNRAKLRMKSFSAYIEKAVREEIERREKNEGQ